MPFGQTDEGHCDLFGMDLSKSAGFAPCYTIDLWERMAKKSGDKSFMNLFSSHPYSGDRASCAEKHLSKNYKLNCQ
jgi:predicted Zn-dependent protease